MLTRQNQGSLDVSYWRMTLLDPWPAHGLSIRLVVVVCASLRVLLHSWCLRAGVGALLRLHGRWSWLPSPGVVSGRCSVRRPLGVTPSEGFVSCKTPIAPGWRPCSAQFAPPVRGRDRPGKVPPPQGSFSPRRLFPEAPPRPTLPKFRMQFPHGTNRRKLENRGISTIRFQNLKHSQRNCMRNCGASDGRASRPRDAVTHGVRCSIHRNEANTTN